MIPRVVPLPHATCFIMQGRILFHFRTRRSSPTLEMKLSQTASSFLNLSRPPSLLSSRSRVILSHPDFFPGYDIDP